MYTGPMLKNITFSVDDKDIAAAREAAELENTTLNELVRDWISEYARSRERSSHLEKAFEALSHLRAGRKFTREEMNER